MKFQLRWNRDVAFASALALAFLAGLFLRLYLLVDQVLIDDEWHGLYYVIGKSPAWLLTHFSIPGATCIPLNFYDWPLGATIGWSELMLRLPSLICGLLCVAICPLLAHKLIGANRAALLAFLLAITGPLPQCYVEPNNFTSHGTYQHRYGSIDWQRSFYSDLTPANFTLTTAIRADEVSPFYGLLAKESGTRPVVEYPMLIGDHFNPLYYHQHFHVGYTTDMTLASGLAPGNIYGNTCVDQVLSLIRDPSKIRFRNLVSMDDLPAMRGRGVEYVILHKRFEAQLRKSRRRRRIWSGC